MFIMSCCCFLTELLFSVYFLRQLYLFIYLLLIIKWRTGAVIIIIVLNIIFILS